MPLGRVSLGSDPVVKIRCLGVRERYIKTTKSLTRGYATYARLTALFKAKCRIFSLVHRLSIKA